METNKKIKILIATGSFGGPATYSKILAEKLPAFGYEVKIVSFGDVLKYPKFLRHIIYFFKLLRAEGADIVYAQDPVSVGLPAMLASKMTRRRFFLKTVGDYAWEQSAQRYGVTDLLDDFVKKNNHSFPVVFFKGLQTFVAKMAEKIIVPSNYLKEIVGKWGIDKNKIAVIYNAFVAPRLNEDKDSLRKMLSFSSPTIVSVGRLVPWKGFPALIDAFAEIRKTYTGAELLIIDDGPDRSALEKKVIDINLGKAVKFLGRIPHEEVYKNIKAADVFTLVSSYEGFSHLILETLSLGTPIVTTPVGGNIEVIKDNENGLLVPFGDISKTAAAIRRILSEKELSERLSIKGKESAVNFSEEKMLKNLAAILR